MGYEEAKKLLIECLKNQQFEIERDRKKALDKNQLYSGKVDTEFVLKFVESCESKHYNGKGYSKADDKLHHIFIKDGWYIKFYLLKDEVRIVSINEEKYHGRLQRK